MANKPALTINLIKKKGTPSLDVFIHWAITGGRFLVILTETIALAAFLYRFSLDRQIIDLHDKIKAKSVIVNVLKEQETSYRVLQERLLQANQLSQDVTFTSELFTKITDIAQRNNLSVKTITVTDESFHIELTAINVTNLKNFVNQLQLLKELQEISIDRIENRSATAQILAVVSSQVVSPVNKITGLKEEVVQ